MNETNQPPLQLYAHDKQSIVNGLILPPKVTAEVLEVFPNLPFRPDDVIVATYPKAGTHWTEEIIWQICNDGVVNKTPIFQRIPYFFEFEPHEIGASIDNIIDVVLNHESRIFKTHFPIDFVPIDEATNDFTSKNSPKYVYIMRNPKDTAVSFFHFYHGAHHIEFDGTWDEFLEMFIRGKVLYGSWFDHVLGWWQRRDEPNIMIVKYEDMKKDLPAAVKQMAEYIGKSLSPDTIMKITQQTTFDAMKLGHEKFITKRFYKESANFFRKGQIGDWKNYFSEEQNRRMDEMIAEKLSGTGLEFDYE